MDRRRFHHGADGTDRAPLTVGAPTVTRAHEEGRGHFPHPTLAVVTRDKERLEIVSSQISKCDLVITNNRMVIKATSETHPQRLQWSQSQHLPRRYLR